jgi:hypothetical protein
MAQHHDPYRVLGLEPGASLDDVKRAYRRLAKANHPDAAGEAALPRFLAIQAAYDQIAGPDAGNRRAVGRRPGGTQRPWEADPERAGATYRAYGGRPRPRPGPRPSPRARPGPRPAGAERADRTDRKPKKATLGSTSYDDVDPETFDPDWGGASWYGTTSGTYWTLNPKEYADPRKHGPEYQARARRAASGKEAPPGDLAPESATVDPEPPAAEPLRASAADTASTNLGADAPPPPTHTTTSWWEATAGEPARASAAEPAAAQRGGYAPPPPVQPRPPAGPATMGGAPSDNTSGTLVDTVRAWLDDPRPTLGGRIGRAVIGWAPIALGIGWGAGEVSGCSRFSASCDSAVAPVSWGIEIAVLALLILLPLLARIATIAAIATLLAVVPASVLLFGTGQPEAMAAARTIVGGLMVVAWVAGLVFAVGREVGRGIRPVS